VKIDPLRFFNCFSNSPIPAESLTYSLNKALFERYLSNPLLYISSACFIFGKKGLILYVITCYWYSQWFFINASNFVSV